MFLTQTNTQMYAHKGLQTLAGVQTKNSIVSVLQMAVKR